MRRASPARPGRRAPPASRSRVTCCSRWARMRRGPAPRCGSRSGIPLSRRTSTLSALSSARSWNEPAGRPSSRERTSILEPMTTLRVLAAMSGGVDSAVAAARAVDAGHEVTGVHLALSRNPSSYRTGARGCCTLEDARDARRAADVIGIPFYVWDLAERFHRDVVQDFVDEYARGNTPNPCLRCNEKIKFAAVLDRAVALGFDAVCTGHHARLVSGADGAGQRLMRSVDEGKDQSYVLAVLTGEQLSRAMFPLGDTTKDQVRREAATR